MITAYELGKAIVEEAQQHRLSEQMVKAYLALAMGAPVRDEFKQSFAYQVLDKRCEAHGIVATDQVKALFAIISDRPGVIVMYAAVLKYIQAKVEGEVMMQDVANSFPIGFPTSDDLRPFWDMQKGKAGENVDNWLDRPEAWA